MGDIISTIMVICAKGQKTNENGNYKNQPPAVHTDIIGIGASCAYPIGVMRRGNDDARADVLAYV